MRESLLHSASSHSSFTVSIKSGIDFSILCFYFCCFCILKRSDANGNKRRYVSARCLSGLIVMTILCAVVGWAAPNLISRTLTRDSQELAEVEAELAFFITFFGEWGDKSQIATIGLAAAENPRGVVLGWIFYRESRMECGLWILESLTQKKQSLNLKKNFRYTFGAFLAVLETRCSSFIAGSIASLDATTGGSPSSPASRPGSPISSTSDVSSGKMMIGDLGIEAKESAFREVAKLLPLPELLLSISSIRQTTLRANRFINASKRIMGAAGVPLVPGYHGHEQDIDVMKSEVDKIGYPLHIKPTHGGGGKGMRIVENPKEFVDAFLGAQCEAAASFSVNTILLEKYITRPRHIEVQNCNLQPDIVSDFRSRLGQATVSAAKAVGYHNAGTVEFIVDTLTGEFYFMEMKTRLQVEHPVTEMIVGQDLVEWQMRVANGQSLPLGQQQIPISVRVETGVEEGDTVSMHYDPMIAKLVVWGENPSLALVKLKDSLSKFQVANLPTNIEFLYKLANHKAFENGELETHFIDHFKDDLFVTPNDSVSAETAYDAAKHNQTRHQQLVAETNMFGFGKFYQGTNLTVFHYDNTIKVWADDGDSDDWHCVQTLGESNSGHSPTVWALSFNSSEDKMVTCSDDLMIKLWDVDIIKLQSGDGNALWEGIIATGAADDAIRLFAESQDHSLIEGPDYKHKQQNGTSLEKAKERSDTKPSSGVEKAKSRTSHQRRSTTTNGKDKRIKKSEDHEAGSNQTALVKSARGKIRCKGTPNFKASKAPRKWKKILPNRHHSRQHPININETSSDNLKSKLTNVKRNLANYINI
ncbi:hypothetical protein L2E82_48264 [Cichorium intybus]|uniref:Uncharacterized protein n=1 Tax=Cichorium intybus TaxID=13427 RepID=A0ACB8YWZ5_CICIN|nr:hypothetical protein L2E82_48264 [Cichorium intybus]